MKITEGVLHTWQIALSILPAEPEAVWVHLHRTVGRQISPLQKWATLLLLQVDNACIVSMTHLNGLPPGMIRFAVQVCLKFLGGNREFSMFRITGKNLSVVVIPPSPKEK